MTNEKYMNMIRNNPYVIDRIENPSEKCSSWLSR